MIDSISTLGLERVVSSEQLTTPKIGAELTGQLEKVNQQLLVADDMTIAAATGNSENLHQVMMAIEQAKLSLEYIVQIRNRVIDAYHEVLRMQI